MRNQKIPIMKKLLTILSAAALAFTGMSTTAEARPCDRQGFRGPATVTYVSGYRNGRPIYTQKTFVGYDRWGNARFSYHTVRGHRKHHRKQKYSRRYRDQGYGHHRYNDRRDSGLRISYTYSR